MTWTKYSDLRIGFRMYEKRRFYQISVSFKITAIIYIILTIFSLLDAIFIPTMITGIMAIGLLIMQLINGILAKLATRDYGINHLGTFGLFMIINFLVTLSATIGLAIITFRKTFEAVIDYYYYGGSSTINILGINMASVVLSIISFTLELIAWYEMHQMFIEEHEDRQIAFKIRLIMIGLFVGIGGLTVGGMPLATMTSEIDFINPTDPVNPSTIPFIVIGVATSMVCYIIITLVYFWLSAKFSILDESVASPSTTGVGGMESSSQEMMYSTGTRKCSSCGAAIPKDSDVQFCPLCGQKI
ncbi:hypothetical protein GF325_18015 [Candidatus Bathyarchaeota archaeon]|nr:hypothetical protein [Candidatus Bathyarchaeota archaeon]